MTQNEFPEADFDDGFEVIEAHAPASFTGDAEPRATEAEAPEGVRRPRLCLMGEFSAGKSTLSNLLLGAPALPVNVTATQLPPVWISAGTDAPYRVALDDQEHDIELEKLDEVSVDDTAYVRVFKQSEFLQHCDLIDMPGISDPNMDAEVWQRVLPIADIVIWCTHATQAWRQSEAAVWSTMPKELQEKSFLLLTRMDRILSERDRMRVIKRVGRETQGMFADLFPISLTRAMAGRDNPDVWEQSGGEAFLEALLGALSSQQEAMDTASGVGVSGDPARVVVPTRVRAKKLTARRPTRGARTTAV